MVAAMRELLLVAGGGAFGSLARYGIGEWTRTRFGESFPWGTLVVNVAGSLLLGLLLGLALSGKTSRPTRALIGTGFLGAFTTFSTFSAESYALIEGGKLGAAAANVSANLVVGLLAAALGFALGRSLGAALG
jgi:fluoride exporter